MTSVEQTKLGMKCETRISSVFGQMSQPVVAGGHSTVWNQIPSLLIWTLISENQGYEKSRPVSKTIFFTSRCQTWKKSRYPEPEIFLGFKTYLDFSRTWFSEIRVQIKRPTVSRKYKLNTFCILQPLLCFDKYCRSSSNVCCT